MLPLAEHRVLLVLNGEFEDSLIKYFHNFYKVSTNLLKILYDFRLSDTDSGKLLALEL